MEEAPNWKDRVEIDTVMPHVSPLPSGIYLVHCPMSMEGASAAVCVVLTTGA